MQIALGSALDGQHAPAPAAPHVQVGQPEMSAPPHPTVEIGTPTQEHTPHLAVMVGEPMLPANPAHHGPYKAQAANMVAYGRRAGWKPQELASALEHARDTYNSGSY